MFGVLNFFGWFVLPNLLTNFLQSLYYRIVTPLGENKPVRNSARHRRDRRRIYAFIIVSYLIFSVVDAYYSVALDPKSPLSSASSLYSSLEIPVSNLADVSNSELRTSFRKLSLKYHPDKVAAAAAAASAANSGRATAGSGILSPWSIFSRKSAGKDNGSYLTWDPARIEEQFIRIKAAYEALSSPVIRFGYERFGPQGVVWAKKFDALMSTAEKDRSSDNSATAQTMLEFLQLGIRSSIVTFYLGAFGSIAGMYTIGYPKTGHVWRAFMATLALVLELFIITRPLHTIYAYIPLMKWLGLLPYQMIQIIHNLMVTSFVAITQLGPIVSVEPEAEENAGGSSTIAAAIAGVPGTGLAGGGIIPPLVSSRGQNVLQKQLEFLEQLTDNVVHESIQSYRHQMLPFAGKDKEQLSKQLKQATVEALVNRRLMDDVEVKDAVSEVTPVVRATIQAERNAASLVNSNSSGSHHTQSAAIARKLARSKR